MVLISLHYIKWFIHWIYLLSAWVIQFCKDQSINQSINQSIFMPELKSDWSWFNNQSFTKITISPFKKAVKKNLAPPHASIRTPEQKCKFFSFMYISLRFWNEKGLKFCNHLLKKSKSITSTICLAQLSILGNVKHPSCRSKTKKNRYK